jgi:hypothetical protein
MKSSLLKIAAVLAITGLLAGCSAKKVGANIFGNAISGGTSVYLTDNDPELVKEAFPFGLKTMEGLLEVTPKHKGLLLSAASGFTSYAYLLQQEADEIDYDDFIAARRLRARATKLYQRGRDYALRGLSLRNETFTENLLADPEATLAATGKKDIFFLYWAGAAWAGALTADKNDTRLIATLPIAGSLVARVLELDETFDDGAGHEFMVSYEATRPGGDLEKSRWHYQRALEISGGKRASLYLALAEGPSVQEQNLEGFKSLINAALSVDADAIPELRLVNTLAHQRAKMLMSRLPDLFLDAE